MARKRRQQVRDPVQALSCDITDRMPLELYEAIIDSLAHDFHALATCALVCRAWFPWSRLHLFHHLFLHEQNFVQFLALLNSQHFGAQVRSRAYRMTMTKNWGPSSWINPLMDRMDGFSINTLTIHDLIMDTTPPLGMAINFQSVTELTLTKASFFTMAHALQIICVLRNLERLSVAHLHFIQQSSATVTEIPAGYTLPPRLEIINLKTRYECELYDILRWFAEHSTLPPIHTLSLRSGFPGELIHDTESIRQCIAKVFKGLGTALHHLTISNITILGTEILSFNTKLRTFHVKDIRLLTSYVSPLRKRMPPIAGKITSANIQMVTFSIVDLSTSAAFDKFDWDGMRAVFSRPEFAQLERINFHVSTRGHIPTLKKEATRLIRAGLPECTARGIVRVSQPVRPKDG